MKVLDNRCRIAWAIAKARPPDAGWAQMRRLRGLMGAQIQCGMIIRPFDAGEAEDVVALWRSCGLPRPWNDPYLDIERKSSVQPDLFLVATDDNRLIGTVMAGYDGHPGWVNTWPCIPMLCTAVSAAR